DVYVSAVNLGSGSVKTEHGILPVPAPATAELLKGFPVYASDVPIELTTPTGAAILRELADGFLSMPAMKIRATGYGAGQREIKGMPNTLRILVGEALSRNETDLSPKVTVVETNIDDMNPQIYEYVMERLLAEGALDVYLTQVIMKKGRPGVVLSVLCDEGRRSEIIDILFQETTTIGVRFHEASRSVLDREVEERGTEFGRIRVKVSRTGGETVTESPEYDDCKRIAKKKKVPLREVMRRASDRKRTRKPL
ncbi:MAG TPA: LarC family nickel insertion protein, partial [Thermodesulfovibrionales bacterium]|nr:LarC family nickel insertion protein [Thermodesulfovibrionales bacterium]